MNLISLKEKAQSFNTLLCLIQGCRGYHTVVELRNDDALQGTIKDVDGYMNVSMTDVQFTRAKTGAVTNFEEFYIQGKQVRYVHIPDELDIVRTIQEQLGIANRARLAPPRQKKKLTKEQRKALLQRQFEEVKAKLAQLPVAQGGIGEHTVETK